MRHDWVVRVESGREVRARLRVWWRVRERVSGVKWKFWWEVEVRKGPLSKRWGVGAGAAGGGAVAAIVVVMAEVEVWRRC